jgi:hypothetical protein
MATRQDIINPFLGNANLLIDVPGSEEQFYQGSYETHTHLRPSGEFEHIRPFSQGGTASARNLQLSNSIFLTEAEHRGIGNRFRLARRRQVISSHLAAAIRASRAILDLEDNWDDEGSPGYAEETWNRATKFIRYIARNYWRLNGVWVIPPRILPGPNGSIDIHWKTQKRELLINIPADEEIAVGYFGSGGPNDTIKGKLDIFSQNEWILMWLLR